MKISPLSLVLVGFVFLFASGYEASKKTKRTFECVTEGEEGEIELIEPETKLARTSNFRFNFFTDQLDTVEDMSSEHFREKAFSIFFYGDKDGIDWLMEMGYDVFGSGLLEELIKMNSYRGIKYLLTNHLSNNKQPIREIFRDAIEYGATALVRFIFDNFRTMVWKKHASFIASACENRRYKILRMMAAEGFNANFVIKLNQGRFYLHEAVLAADFQWVKALLQFKDLEVNCSDDFGNTPLHYAANVEIVEALMANGADPFQINRNGLDSIGFAMNAKRYGLVHVILPSLYARYEHFHNHFKAPQSFIFFQRTFIIDRQRVLEDSFYLGMREPNWFKMSSSYEINFEGETGVDRGGLTREWMSLLIERLFVPRLVDERVVNEDEEVAEAINESENLEESGSSGTAASSVADDHIYISSSSSVLEAGEETFNQHGSNNAEEQDFESNSYGDRNSDGDDEDNYEVLAYLGSGGMSITVYDSTKKRVPKKMIEIYYNAPFECVDSENRLYRISSKFTGPVEVYKFIGSIVAKSLLRKNPLKVKLVPSLIKMLLGRTLTFEDLKDDDGVMYKSMLHCLKPGFDFESAFYTLPSDENVVVNSVNVHLFLNEIAVNAMYLRQKEQTDLFIEGFWAVINHENLGAYFRPEELQAILRGSEKVDRQEIYKSIEINGKHWINHSKLFWEAMDLLQDGELIELVRFVTGINGLPFGGVSALDKKLKIFDETRNKTPRASTCNFHLSIPTIGTLEELLEIFHVAISSEPEFVDHCCF